MSYSYFSKWCEKKNKKKIKKCKETETNFEGTYLSDGLVDSAQI